MQTSPRLWQFVCYLTVALVLSGLAVLPAHETRGRDGAIATEAVAPGGAAVFSMHDGVLRPSDHTTVSPTQFMRKLRHFFGVPQKEEPDALPNNYQKNQPPSPPPPEPEKTDWTPLIVVGAAIVVVILGIVLWRVMASAPATPPMAAAPVAAAAMAWLDLAGSGLPLARLDLHDGVVMIGRDPSADLRLPDAKVSQRHAMLTISGAACTMRDLGSSNGTFVNGQRVDQTALRDGDTIMAGSCQFRFRSGGPLV